MNINKTISNLERMACQDRRYENVKTLESAIEELNRLRNIVRHIEALDESDTGKKKSLKYLKKYAITGIWELSYD